MLYNAWLCCTMPNCVVQYPTTMSDCVAQYLTVVQCLNILYSIQLQCLTVVQCLTMLYGAERCVRVHLLPFRNLDNFVHPTLPASFGRESKSPSFLPPGVYARGSKRSYTWKRKKPVVDSQSQWSIAAAQKLALVIE